MKSDGQPPSPDLGEIGYLFDARGSLFTARVPIIFQLMRVIPDPQYWYGERETAVRAELGA